LEVHADCFKALLSIGGLRTRLPLDEKRDHDVSRRVH
jgi:hypothetical protein